MKCDVYWNLHKHLYSVRDRATGIVQYRLHHMVLHDVTFIIQRAGQQKVRRTRRKQVHAYLRGTLGGRRFERTTPYGVYYDPYKHDTFVALCQEDGRLLYRSIEAAKHVMCSTIDGHPHVIAYEPTLGKEVTPL